MDRLDSIEETAHLAAQRRALLRRWVLGLLAVAILALTAFAGPAGRALAQLPPLTTTPTPDRRVLNEIASPRSNDAVAGLVAIIGTALVQDFIRYEVHIAPSGMENWQWLETHYDVVRDGVLAAWNTFLFPTGATTSVCAPSTAWTV